MSVAKHTNRTWKAVYARTSESLPKDDKDFYTQAIPFIVSTTPCLNAETAFIQSVEFRYPNGYNRPMIIAFSHDGDDLITLKFEVLTHDDGRSSIEDVNLGPMEGGYGAFEAVMKYIRHPSEKSLINLYQYSLGRIVDVNKPELLADEGRVLKEVLTKRWVEAYSRYHKDSIQSPSFN